MLLRNRSRAVTKPGLMGDHSSQPSPNQSYIRTIPSLFSPKFRDFSVKCLSGAEALRSPTSILDTRALTPFGNPLSHEKKIETFAPPRVPSENRTSWDSKGIGLALVGALKDEPVLQTAAKPCSGTVLFGTKHRVKIPPLPLPPSSSESTKTCAVAGFAAKTKDSQKQIKDSPLSVATGVMSLSEMELFEEYTCVISHGPNPRTTHIFDNCIVESYCSLPNNTLSPSLNFLSICHTCKKHLQQTNDIFIYRGEKAFCSKECRQEEMVLDGAEISEFDEY
ncbi:FCS-Like Zinc finger 8-like [Vigna umbellata]|uniref:FCS-Like Zinc finger 8-like n=1 Tax=Vigna umbellata TaxID=87088 RepID=UPI001F5E5715|nr:FCS-Like Zinc finger 8-like [Vigna umbellata]